jgi:hypothetical protein
MDYLKLDGKNIKVIAGGPVTDLFRNEANYKQYKPEIQFFQIPSYGQVEYQFLISGKGKVKLLYHSEKATDRVKEIEL